MEQTYIAIMIQSLEKKEQVLDKIIELDTVQKNQLQQQHQKKAQKNRQRQTTGC